MKEDKQIKCGATILDNRSREKKSINPFELRVRWLIGDEGAHFHRIQDHFKVSVKLKDGSTIDETGHINKTGYKIQIHPKGLVMVEPPRKRILYPDYQGGTPDSDRFYWMKGVKPTSPASCSNLSEIQDPNGFSKNRSALSICSLFKELDSSRIKWRLAHAIYDSISNIIHGNVISTDSIGLKATELAEQIANLIFHRESPHLSIESAYTDSIRQLNEGTSTVPKLFRIKDDQGRIPTIQVAAVIGKLIEKPMQRELINSLTINPHDTKEKLALSMLQGGFMIDYWDNTHNDQSPPKDNDRGVQYTAASLLGNGINIPLSIEMIKLLKDKDLLPIQIKVFHVPGTPPKSDPIVIKEGENFQAGEIAVGSSHSEPFPSSNIFQITKAHFDKLENEKSTFPAYAPKKAWINYDLSAYYLLGDSMDKSKKSDGDHEENYQYNYRTGDGRLEMLIEPDWDKIGEPDDSKTQNTFIAGINVYGIWEGHLEKNKSLQQVLSEGSEQEKIDALKPYLISKRYSYLHDLKDTFPSNPDGSEHPSLKNNMFRPPWQATLIKPRGKYFELEEIDEKSSNKNSLPSSRYDGLTLFSLDIRKGIKEKYESNYEELWDSNALPNDNWDPRFDRRNKELNKPEAYQFWVSCVDMFEQESNLTQVICEVNEEAEELYKYYPRYRRPILPPPANNASNKGVFLEFINTVGDYALKVNWETPFIQKPDSTDIMNGQHGNERWSDGAIDSHVIVVRRLIKKPVEINYPIGVLGNDSMFPDIEPFNNPQWQLAEKELVQENENTDAPWIYYDHKEFAEHPVAGDYNWNHNFHLNDVDRGYEYMALISTSVSEKMKPFWFEDKLTDKGDGRILKYTIESNESGINKFTEYEKEVSELPQQSSVVQSEGLKIINPNKPSSLFQSDPAVEFIKALPILSPDRLDRDMILKKLSNYPVLGCKVDFKPLTCGQAAMIETSHARCNLDIPLEKMPVFNHILKSGFVSKIQGTGDQDNVDVELNTHETIGFRGCIAIKGIAQNNPQEGFAIPIKARIFQTRIPLLKENAISIASYSGNFESKSVKSSLILNQVQGSGDFSIMINDETPLTLVVFSEISISKSSVKFYSGITNIKKTDDGNFEINISKNHDFESGESGEFYIIKGDIIYEQDISSLKNKDGDFIIHLPVGGGVSEIFSWTLASVSAQGKLCSRANQFNYGKRFKASIVPPEVSDTIAVTPEKIKHSLDGRIAEHKNWLPKNLLNSSASISNPRVLLTWRVNEISDFDSVYVQIERRSKSIDEDEDTLFESDFTIWDTLNDIQNSTIETGILSDQLETIIPWLLGGKAPSPDEPTDEGILHVGPNAFLSNRNGKQIHLSAKTGLINYDNKRVAFVDYFRSSENDKLSMNEDRLYSYRISSYRNIGTESDPIYLISSSSDWTGWIKPSSPAIKVTHDEQVDTCKTIDDSMKLPRVKFNFVVSDIYNNRLPITIQSNGLKKYWEYRIIAKRKVVPSILNREKSDYFWEEIDKPLVIIIKENDSDDTKPSSFIIDNEIDHQVGLPQMEFQYSFFVSQYLISSKDGVIVSEELMRTLDPQHENGFEVSITLKSSCESINEDVEVSVKLDIDKLDD